MCDFFFFGIKMRVDVVMDKITRNKAFLPDLSSDWGLPALGLPVRLVIPLENIY